MRNPAGGCPVPKLNGSALPLALVGGLAVAGGPGVAQAYVISAMPEVSFASVPAEITLGGGSFIFTADTVPGDPPAEVSTSGGGEVASTFDILADFPADASIDQDGQAYFFLQLPSPTPIPNSSADDFIGLSFILPDGLHFGYAEVDGTELVSYGFESVANTTILTGAVPEPATMALFATGVAGLASLRPRRRKAVGPTQDDVTMSCRCRARTRRFPWPTSLKERPHPCARAQQSSR